MMHNIHYLGGKMEQKCPLKRVRDQDVRSPVRTDGGHEPMMTQEIQIASLSKECDWTPYL